MPLALSATKPGVAAVMELSVEVLPAGRVSVQKYEKVGVVKHCEVGWIESVAVSSRKNWFGARTKVSPAKLPARERRPLRTPTLYRLVMGLK